MSDLLISAALSHLAADEREAARAMLTVLGLRRYSQLSRGQVVDIWTLKLIYAKALADMNDYHSQPQTQHQQHQHHQQQHHHQQHQQHEHQQHQHQQLPQPRREYSEESKSSQTFEEAARPFSLNATRQSRSDVLDRFPFRDFGDIKGLLEQPPPGPSFLSLGVPLRKRLAAKVYGECAAGSAGMKVCDIPRGLEALGLQIGDDLAKGFRGSFSSTGLSLSQWQGVVKRFAAKEEEAAKLKLKQRGISARQTFPSAPHGYGAGPGLGDGVGPAASAPSSSTYPAPIGGHSSDRHKEAPLGGLPGLSDGARQPTAVGIADSFLRGTVGRLVVSRPDGWWGEENEEHQGREASANEEYDALIEEEQQKAVLHSLGLLARPSGVGMLTLSEPSHATLSLKEAALLPGAVQPRVAKKAEPTAASTANPDKGWRRAKGGLVADFGPPNVLRSKTAPLIASPSQPQASQVPPHLMAMLRPARPATLSRTGPQSVAGREARTLTTVRGQARGSQGGAVKQLSLAEHRRNSRARLAAEHQQHEVEEAKLLAVATDETRQAFERISQALAGTAASTTSSAASAVSAVSGNSRSSSSSSSSSVTDPSELVNVDGSPARKVHLEPRGVKFIGGSDSETDSTAGPALGELSQSVVYFDANVSIDSSAASREEGFGYEVYGEPERDEEEPFAFTTDNTAFLGAGLEAP